MRKEQERLTDHERFKELGALANSGTLTACEWSELKNHLQNCEECREIYSQYQILTVEGIPMLAARYGHREEQGNWDDAASRNRLFARVRAAKQQTSFEPAGYPQSAVPPNLLRRIQVIPLASAALAACLVVAVGLGAYHLGGRGEADAKQAQASAEDSFQKLAAEMRSVEGLIDAQKQQLVQLQEEDSQKEQELAKLRSALRTVEDAASELAAAKGTTDEQLQAVAQQRDVLSDQLRDAERAYQSVHAELVSLRAERNRALLRAASLEFRIEELVAVNAGQERKLKIQEQYLAADRDIRDLMGARKLYIADVFDVDSQSQTRKPFGRIFYTQGKSLIFYAFDLDRQPGVKNASTFQAWGRKGFGQSQPFNLGILYMDNESSRRWALRFDDPQQLAEIDAVFVTIEPRGGSEHPTGKPFLYALLRKEPNHP